MKSEKSHRSRMLDANSMLLLLVVGVLPNAFFFAASMFFLAERMISPLLYVVAALVMIFVSPVIGWLAFFLVAAADLGLMILYAFHLPLPLALDSMKYIASIDVRASLLYVAILAIVTGSTVLSAWLTQRNRDRFRLASPTPVVMLALALFAYDRVYTFPYFQIEPAGFESARTLSGLSEKKIVANGRNLLVVMVEGLGAFADPDDRRIFETALRKDLPAGRFDFRTGTTAYKGSTTGAAARELCGEWADYLNYLDGERHDCLPAKLARAGYKTIAYHGFSSQMFERDRWYPDIGFTELQFHDTLLRDHGAELDRRCGSVFTGLCDEQLGKVVHARLLDRTDDPKMIYWLTLNSHVPFVAEKGGALGCDGPQPRIDERTVCELSEIWLHVFERVNEIAADPDLPPTDILLVGDHHTPLWRRAAKDKFILGRVDWYLLSDRRNGPHLAQSAAN